ncbi:Signal transducer and transcription activator [Trichoplax sp. H2]|nr:Signal transducer and transcription activator [Trichoplax sp. H2]|eukprot:RDD41588.1 Signal transducer and transcription activator [Trichoplax sp. H2]
MMEIPIRIIHFLSCIYKFLEDFAANFNEIVTQQDREAVLLWFQHSSPSLYTYDSDKAKIKIWLSTVLLHAIDKISSSMIQHGEIQVLHLEAWLLEIKRDLGNHTLPAIRRCSEQIDTGEYESRDVNCDSLDEIAHFYKHYITLKIIHYQTSSLFSQYSQSEASYLQYERTHSLCDPKLILADPSLKDLFKKLVVSAVSLHQEMIHKCINQPQQEVLENIKAWKRRTRLHSDVSTFPIASTDALRAIRYRLIALMQLQDSMIELIQETTTVISTLNSYGLALELQLNFCYEYTKGLLQMKNELLRRSFFVMIQCFPAPKVDGTITCKLVLNIYQPLLQSTVAAFNVNTNSYRLLADNYVKEVSGVAAHYIGFTDQHRDQYKILPRMQKEQYRNGDRGELLVSDIKIKLHKASRGNQSGGYVTDFRYQLGFHCNITTIKNVNITLECRTLPFVFRTGRAQNAKAQSTLAWDNYFLDDVDTIDINCLKHEEKITFAQLEEILQCEFKRRLGKPLTPANLDFLKSREIHTSYSRNEDFISWDDFHYLTKLGNKNKSCSVGEWIFTCLEVLAKPENSLLRMWQDEHIVGFISRSDVEESLRNQPRKCLIRFSQQVPGAITIPYTDENSDIHWPKPIQCSGSQSTITWIDLILIDGRLNSSILCPKQIPIADLMRYRKKHKSEILVGYDTSFPILSV